ncbi:MAG: hypothetical protein FWB97_08445 [Oscillospiraceae bacterium]|nr:hypothetical protein [Oscillospiraceae bacterium]
MKKRVISLFAIFILGMAFLSEVSQAASPPYFVIINETKLPYNEDTMPFYIGNDIFIPVVVLTGLGVWEVSSEDFVRLYRGTRYVNFYTRPGEARTVNQDGTTLRWPHARRVGTRFFVPLRHVSDFFGLSYQIVPVPASIIPERQMQVLRIISDSIVNGPTAVGMNRDELRASFLEHFAAHPPPPGNGATQLPGDDVPPDYSDVTIHLSFFDISAGSAVWVLDLLDIQAESGFHACFFVNADDIRKNPDLIRRISGTGHALGIWLEDGTFEEYLETSALLFEAAKVRTVIVSAGYATETAAETAAEHGLIFWDGFESLVDYSAQSVAVITANLPREGGDRKNLLFPCTEGAASVLPGVYSYLRANEFTVERITETVMPLAGSID